MVTMLAALAGAVVLGVAAIAASYVLGMRARSPLVLRPLIRLQRVVINPRQMRSAGQPGAYASVIRHRGRVSGRDLETPVDAVPVEDGFVIALVYGERTQWLRNVLAGGSATIVHDGRTVAVDRPQVIPMGDAEAFFPAGDRRGFHVLGVDSCLRVRRADPAAAGAPAGAPRGDGRAVRVAVDTTA